MQIESNRTQGCLNLKLSGRLETSTAPELQAVIEKELEGTDELKLDMEGIEYVSSAGLRVLLAASKEMKAKGGNMIVSNVNDDVMEVFEITGFKEILNIV
ncbi:MAG: STAS domain-containing protein [Lachnospiraceae bacterium]|nr:STAS domain-containing protein [Lachnospiraceae bacterium]